MSPAGIEAGGPASTSGIAGSSSTRFWLAALLFAFAGAAFLRTLGNDFITFDDYDYITGNFRVRHGLTWENVRWAFTAFRSANWHPLTWLSHMLDVQVFGLQPWGHHLTSVLIHAVNTSLVFLVLSKMTGTVWRAAFVAALFGVHPLHVESVAWAAERKDVLSTLFWLGSLWSYAAYVADTAGRNRKHAVYYSLSLGLLALALMCKPMPVTAPCLMLLLDWWPLNRWGRTQGWRLVVEKLPFFLSAAISSVITSMAQRGAMDTTGYFPVANRLGNALLSYARYLGKLVLPVNLSAVYPHAQHLPSGQVILAAFLVLGISVFALAMRARQPWLLAGWLWFVGTLVPVIGLVQVGSQAMADRYSYVPSIGIFIAVVWGVPALISRHRTVALAGAAAVLVLCSGLTWRQIGYWRDSETLFRHALAITDNNYVALINLGTYAINHGHLDEAVTADRQALRINPDCAEAHNDLGLALEYQGHLDDALAEYENVVRLNSRSAQGHFNLGMMLKNRGRIDEAIDQFGDGLKLEPDVPQAHDVLGVMFAQRNRLPEAIVQFQDAVRLDPDDEEAKGNLSLALKMQNEQAHP